MALVEIIKWDAAPDDLIWKHPNSELSTKTQVIVNESQVAALYKDGQFYDLLTAGRHTLSTNNIPLLNRLVNLPFAGRSPFAAEVWFVNRALPLNLKWGTATPMELEDPQYGLVIPVSAYGQMGIQIVDPGAFLVSLVGTLRSFTTAAVLDYFKGVLISNLKASIAKAIVARQIPLLHIDVELVSLAESIQQEIAPAYRTFGLDVRLFRIMGISFPQDDPSVLELKKAKAAAARRKIEGTTYQQERAFDTLQAGAGNQGIGGAFGAIGTGLALGQQIGNMAAQQVGNWPTAPAAQVPPPMSEPPPFVAPAAAPAPRYFAHLNNRQEGPLSLEQVSQAIASGQITSQTPMWRNGLAAWGPASSVPELANLLAASAMPPPFAG